MRPAPEPGVTSWVDSLDVADIWLTVVTAAELMCGVARLPNGRRRRELRAKVDGLLAEDFQDRILPFDALAATHYADIVADRERSGLQISMAYGQIAAIAATGTPDSRRATSVTSLTPASTSSIRGIWQHRNHLASNDARRLRNGVSETRCSTAVCLGRVGRHGSSRWFRRDVGSMSGVRGSLGLPADYGERYLAPTR
nr:hypothetical protein [Mycobacterium sp. E802]